MPIKIESSSVVTASRCGPFVLTLVLVGAMLLGPGWGIQRCAAQSFPTMLTDEQTFSIGVVQIVVDPSFDFLFRPAPSFLYYYPGYAGPGSGILTGPVMYDSHTIIGESVSHVRPASGTIVVGTPNGYPNAAYANVQAYTDYSLVPSQFANAAAGLDEIFTQIKQMDLIGYVDTNGASCSDPRVPSIRKNSGGQGAGPQVTVQAGPLGLGIGATLPLNRRSIGMVQETTGPGDFPAQSFFDVFVEVTLPPVPNTMSLSDFPAAGAVLYNDTSNPLLIQNPSITNLPPEVTYIHGQSTAVPIRFKSSHPPYWAADDVLGYLTLAGHGVITNVVTATAPCPAASAPGGLLDLTLGPIGAPIPPPPIPWLRPTNSFPTPDSTYNSVVNTFVDPSSGITNVLDDTATFPNGTVTNRIRDLILGSFPNPIDPPTPNNATTYTDPNIQMTFEISPDGQNWVTGQAAGPVTLTISNSTAAGSTSTFDMEMLQLDAQGTTVLGPVRIRESPTLQSLGRHTSGPDPRGYRVSSFFDVFLELSTDDGVSWVPAGRSMRLLSSLPPPVPNSIFIRRIGPDTVLDWQNQFTLQSTPSLAVPFADVAGPVTTGPYTNASTATAQFFRLRN